MSVYEPYSELILGLGDCSWKKHLSALKMEGPLDEDMIAADHYSVFGLNIFPLRDYFLNQDGHIYNELTELYQKFHFDHEDQTGGMGATHLGVQLKFLDHLENSKGEFDGHLLKKTRQAFLKESLFDWILPLKVSMHYQPSRVFQKIVDQLFETLLGEIVPLEERNNIFLPPYPEEFLAKNFIESEETRLKDIISYLLNPYLSGIFLTRTAIVEMGRSLDIPFGFGERKSLLDRLFKEAGQYEVTTKLIILFRDHFGEWKGHYKKAPQNLGPYKDFWCQKVENTLDLFSMIDETLEKEKRTYANN